MNARLNINGFGVDAFFDDDSIQNILLPLLRELSLRQRELERRLVVLLAAPPGAGKSTLAAFLELLSRSDSDFVPLQALGMDGFHFHQDYILSHFVGNVPMRLVKGTPESFDVDKLRRALEAVQSGDILWSYYDRNLHDVVEDSIPVSAPIVLIEGNWLLLDRPEWNLPGDMRIFIDADESLLRGRLIRRKQRGGVSIEEAEAHYDRTDGPNIRLCRDCRRPADLTLSMTGDGTYRKIERKKNIR